MDSAKVEAKEVPQAHVLSEASSGKMLDEVRSGGDYAAKGKTESCLPQHLDFPPLSNFGSGVGPYGGRGPAAGGDIAGPKLPDSVKNDHTREKI